MNDVRGVKIFQYFTAENKPKPMRHPLLKITLSLFLIFFSTIIKAQAPLIKTKKYFNSNNGLRLIVYDVKPTRTNGFILAGSDSTHGDPSSSYFTGEYKSMGNRPFLIKADSVGKELWRKNLAITDSPYNAAFTSVLEADNGDFIATGKYWDNANAYQMLVARFTTDGNLVWQKKYGGTGDDVGYVTEVVTGEHRADPAVCADHLVGHQ